MPLVQKRKKLNDFQFGQTVTYYGHNPIGHALDKHRGVLMLTTDGKNRYYQELKDKTKLYVYHIEKRRAKFIQVARNRRDKEGRRKTESTRVHLTHWKVRLFEFDSNEVKSLIQHQRHFTVVLK